LTPSAPIESSAYSSTIRDSSLARSPSGGTRIGTGQRSLSSRHLAENLADFMPHLLAGSAYLTAEERATVLWLVPRFPAARLEELKAKLLNMSPRNGAKWLRANLAALRAEVSA
jgi:hypothetical protein